MSGPWPLEIATAAVTWSKALLARPHERPATTDRRAVALDSEAALFSFDRSFDFFNLPLQAAVASSPFTSRR